MKTLLLVHGPNLNKLGSRDPEIYGSMTLQALDTLISERASKLGYEIITFQSNHEGDLIDFIQSHADKSSGMIINPGALSHYSYALHDAIIDFKHTVIEVHLSNIKAREPWRAHSVIAPACLVSIYGKHIEGYIEALDLLTGHPNLVIGNPIKHSKSPSFHDAAYQKLGINTRLLALENPPLPRLIQYIRNHKIPLIAVTLPFKTEIIQYTDIQSEAVKALGAANTLIYKNDLIEAHNTDVDGILSVLQEIKLLNKSVMILGAGGAARALGYALQNTGATLFWHNRTRSKAEALKDLFGGEVIDAPVEDVDLIVNTSPIGMSPLNNETPLVHYPFQSHQTVFDMVYHPIETRLLKEAAQAGARCLSGLSMFEAQALKQIELCYQHIST